MTLKNILPSEYKYKLEPQISFLQLREEDFDQKHNVDYRYMEKKAEKRGDVPHGWYGHALNVSNRYLNNRSRLRKNDVDEKWPVAFLRTNTDAVKDVGENGVLFNLIVAKKEEPVQQQRRVEYDKDGYCVGIFNIKHSPYKSEKYQLAIQCRVKPDSYTTPCTPDKDDDAFYVPDPEAIRPCYVLIKDK